MKATTRWAAFLTLVIAGVTACGNDSGKEARPDALSATQVCDGTLDTAAAAALKILGGTDRFTEIEGKKESGIPYKFSLKHAAETLHETPTKKNACLIYKADGKNDFPLLDISFQARKSHPDLTEEARSSDSGEMFFPLGLFASARGEDSTSLYFACPTSGPDGKMPYVEAEMFSARGQVNPDGKGRMTVLNAVSRAVAEELSCAAEARLPAEVPDALAG